MAAFSVFGEGMRLSAKVEHQMVATRLAEKIMEEIRSRKNSEILSKDNVSFSGPFADYLYSIEIGNYPGPFGIQNVERVTILVMGPVNRNLASPSIQTGAVQLTALLSRQPYP